MPIRPHIRPGSTRYGLVPEGYGTGLVHKPVSTHDHSQFQFSVDDRMYIIRPLVAPSCVCQVADVSLLDRPTSAPLPALPGWGGDRNARAAGVGLYLITHDTRMDFE